MSAIIILAVTIVTLFQRSFCEIDLRYIDETVDPCGDFYQFSCGNFDKYHTRPEDEPLLDLFTLTEDELIQVGKDILTSPKLPKDSTALRKAKSAYKSCTVLDKVDSLWYYEFPERKIIDEFGGMPLINDKPMDRVSWTEVGEFAGKFGIHMMFQFFIANFDPENYILLLMPDSLETPEMIRPQTYQTYDDILEEQLRKLAQEKKPFSNDDDDPLDTFLWKIAQHLLRSYGDELKGDKDLTKDLGELKHFMSQLYAGGIIDDEMIPLDDYPVSLSTLQNWTTLQFGDEVDIDWLEFFDQHFKWANINVTEDFSLYILDTSIVYGILNLVRRADPGVVKNYLFLKTFLYMAPDSDYPVREAFEEYIRALGLEYYDRSTYCTRKILDLVDAPSLNFAVLNEYLHYHFDVNKIPTAVELIKNINQVFKADLLKTTWVDAESRAAISQKLDNIEVYLGFPRFAENRTSLDRFYENVRICDWDNYGNARRIRAFKQAYTLKQFEDHQLWSKSPFEVNAFSLRANIRIIAPLAILTSSFLTSDESVYAYSRFGHIIAHEYIHHFDESGINYNENGSQLSPLLSAPTKNSFLSKTQCLKNQYSSYYVPEIGAYLNGSTTLNENLADNSGLRHAFAAFKKIAKNKRSDGKSQKFSKDQLFFISYATAWCSQQSRSYLQKLIDGNQYAPNRFRVIGTLSNMQEFSDAFNCPTGSGMNPEDKCLVW